MGVAHSQCRVVEVTSTANQDNPLMTNIVERPGTPLLGMDVWERVLI